MFRRFFAPSNLAALALLGTLLMPRPAAAQLGQGRHLYEWSGHQGSFSGGSSYGSGYGSSYYRAPAYYYPMPAYLGRSPSGQVSGFPTLSDPQTRGDYAYGATTSESYYGSPLTLPVRINVSVPASAQIWFDDARTTQMGEFRHFFSPPLAPGRDYSYEVKATWTQDGKPTTQTRHVTVHAGDVITLSFLPAGAGTKNP
jgi:uncharacterized protein (TIGR03000 family)